MTLPVAPVDGRPCWRIIPSRFPPIQRFEPVTGPDERAAVFGRDSLTRQQLRHEAGGVGLVPPEDRINGPGININIAAFIHRVPDGSSVADGTFGVFYAANDLETAIAETKFDRALHAGHRAGADGTRQAGPCHRPRWQSPRPEGTDSRRSADLNQ